MQSQGGKEFVTSSPALQKMLKEVTQVKKNDTRWISGPTQRNEDHQKGKIGGDVNFFSYFKNLSKR